jgi:Ca2+-dependent lipid-binding protein
MKTKVCEDGGKNPVWEDVFNIELFKGDDNSVLSIKDSVIIRLWDQDVTSNDPLGFTLLPLSALCFRGGSDSEYRFYFEGKCTG